MNIYYFTKSGLENTFIEKTALPTGGPQWGSGKWTTKTWKDGEGNTSFLWGRQERLQRGGSVWVVVTEEQEFNRWTRKGQASLTISDPALGLLFSLALLWALALSLFGPSTMDWLLLLSQFRFTCWVWQPQTSGPWDKLILSHVSLAYTALLKSAIELAAYILKWGHFHRNLDIWHHLKSGELWGPTVFTRVWKCLFSPASLIWICYHHGP